MLSGVQSISQSRNLQPNTLICGFMAHRQSALVSAQFKSLGIGPYPCALPPDEVERVPGQHAAIC